jgi:hypothetical protein
VLDATATPEKVAALFGVGVDEIDIRGDDPLDIPNLRVTQVLDGQYHAGTIDDAVEEERALADRIQRTIDTAADVHDKPLYVVKKGLRDRFDFPKDGVVTHYHALRGLNVDDCDAVVCIGAPHPRIDDLRRDAEMLAMGHPDLDVGGEEHSTRPDAPNPPVYRKLHYEDDDGGGRAVPTKHYTGLVGALFREAREKELAQAVHRIRPLLADETKHAYLLTNVPTHLAIDHVATFEELADPLQAMMPVADGAIDLLGAVRDVVAGDGADGFRAADLVERRDDGTAANKVKGYHRLAQLSGLDVTLRTVYDWIHDLEGIGLLQPENYEQRAGVSYAASLPTLNSVLSLLSGNGGFKVASKRRLRALAAEADSAIDWLKWAWAAFGVDPAAPNSSVDGHTAEQGGPPPG